MIEVDPVYFRPTEVPHLQGDYSKAKSLLNWSPTYSIDNLIEEMVNKLPEKHKELCDLVDHFSNHYIKNDDIKRKELYEFMDKALSQKFEIEMWCRNIVYYTEMRMVPFDMKSEKSMIKV